MFKRLAPTGLLAALMITAMTTATHAATTTYIYDVGDEVGSDSTLMSSDNWTGDHIDAWISGAFSGDLYARNRADDNGGFDADSNIPDDNSIFRANDAGFSYAIPVATTTHVSLEIIARSVGFFEAGLADGLTPRLGLGANFGADDKFYIFDNFTRTKEATTNADTDVLNTVRVDFDLLAGTADLVLNDSTTLLDDTAMGLTAGTLAATDSLFIRTGTRFAGPARFTLTVTTIPAPAALSGGLTLIAGVLARRRRV